MAPNRDTGATLPPGSEREQPLISFFMALNRHRCQNMDSRGTR